MNHLANKRVLAIAWPMMLTSMSVPLLGLVDTALLGHFESARYLGAVAIGANFVGLMYWSFGFLRMGTTSLVSQSVGREKQNTTAADPTTDGTVFRALWLAALSGSMIALITPAFSEQIVQLMNASDDVSPHAIAYINIRLFSAPAAFMVYAISGWLVGIQKPKHALILVLTSNIINILLDILLIVVLDMRSDGAAWATLIAEYCGFAVGIWMLLHHSQVLNTRRWKTWFVAKHFKTMLGINYHLMLRTLLLLFTLNFFTAQGAAISDTVLAANAILLQLALLSAYVMDGFTYAVEALCGEAYGARQKTAFQRYVKIGGTWIFATAIVFSVVYLLAGNLIISWFSNFEPVRETAETYRYWLVIMPIAGFAAYLMDGVFIGAGQTKTMHLSMWFAVAGVFLPLWWLTTGWANDGLWLAFILFNLARGLSLSVAYRKIWPA